MRQSQLFSKTRKEAPKDETAVNAQLLIRAGYVDKLMAGVYTFLPLGLRVLKKIENIIRSEMNKAGGVEILMPSLQPKENWVQTGRWNIYDSLFKFTSICSETDYVLGPTHEEVVSPLLKKFNLSYKNLPLNIFQIQTKFRDEKRAKSGILRGREFLMKDLYSFHVDESDLDKYYEKVKDHYKNIYDKCGIGEKTYLTFASGGTFSKYSHEYQTVTEAGEDIIYICPKCKVAINKEIIKEQKGCPECGNEKLDEMKAVEVGNIFKLKTKYSEPFKLEYVGEDGKNNLVIMGCYGIGLTRLLGTIVEISHDENGIIWPEAVAPFAVHLIKVGGKKKKDQSAGNDILKKKVGVNEDEEKDAVDVFAERVYELLQNRGIEVLYDDREGASAGEKFADSDLMGIPYRAVVSEKTVAHDQIEVKKRNGRGVEMMEPEDLAEMVAVGLKKNV